MKIDKYYHLYGRKLGVIFEEILNPVRRGWWEEVKVMPEAYDIAGVKTWASMLRCSNCGFTTVAIEGGLAQYNYCPNCGARMEEKDEY